MHVNHDPTRVICFTLMGPIPAQKITLRCKSCELNYRYEMYGGAKIGGYRYYDDSRDYISASNVIYVHVELCEQWMAAAYVHIYSYI